MLARCARCQGTFTTDRYGRQTCPHCGSELLLPDPAAPAGASEAEPPPEPPRPPPPPAPPPSSPPVPPAAYGGGPGPPPPSGPPPGGYGPPGGWPPPPGGGWGSYPPPPPGGPPGPAGPEAPSPFAERRQRGFFSAFFETWKLVATQPQQFFARVRIDQTGTAILFGVIASTIGNVASSIYGFFSGQQAIVAMQEVIERLPEDQARFVRMYMEALSGSSILAQAVLSPLLTLIFIYIGAGILHVLLMLFRGAGRGFDATLTVTAYVHGLLLLLAVPGCGGLLAFVWGLVVAIIGLGAAQRCSTGKAAAAVLAPAALLCVCCCGVLGLTLPAFLQGAQDTAQQRPTTNL